MSRSVSVNAAYSFVHFATSSVVMFSAYRLILEHLGVEILGIWSVVLASAVVMQLGEIGLPASVLRHMALHSAMQSNISAVDVVVTALIMLIPVMIVLALVMPAALGWMIAKLFPDLVQPLWAQWLPLICVAVALNAVASVGLAGLEALQRYDLRAFVSVGAQGFYLMVLWKWLPVMGEQAVGLAYLVQALCLCLFVYFVLGSRWSITEWLAARVTRAGVHSLAAYGWQVQASNAMSALFEPLIKMLVLSFGGASNAGFYDMAYQFMSRVKSLLASGNQVVVAKVAASSARSDVAVAQWYRMSLGWMLLAVPAAFVAALGCVPMLSIWWIGDVNEVFLQSCWVVALVLAISSLNLPAYYVNQGSGRIIDNTSAHLLMVAVLLGLGPVLGWMMYLPGVLLAVGLSHLAGTVYLLKSARAAFSMCAATILPDQQRWVFPACFVCLGIVAGMQFEVTKMAPHGAVPVLSALLGSIPALMMLATMSKNARGLVT